MSSQCKRVVAAILATWVLLFSAENGNAQERSPVPDAAAEQAAKKAAGEIYGGRFALAKTADEKTALAEEIIAAGLKLQAGSADQYVLLDIGREIAAGAGDAPTALSAARELARRFDLPGVALEADTLLIAARWARITPQRTALAEAAGEVIGKLVEADEYERAIRLCEAAQKIADQAREFRLARDFSNALPELRTAQQQFQQYRDALAVLNDEPVAPEANLTAGRYLCFVQGDWELGVPMLALGSDEPLKNVAVMELQGAETAEAQAAIGDAWWDVAETREGQERDLLRLRAGSWYRRAGPQLAGLAGLRVKQRLEEIAKLDREIPAASSSHVSSTPPLAIAPFDERIAKRHQVAWAKHLGVPITQTNSIGMRLVLVPPGEFFRASSSEAQNTPPGRTLQHRVRISQPFFIGGFEVTQAEYQRIMGTNPGKFQGEPRRPVEQVSWRDAQEFCQKLSEKDNRVYRLPTEAEWEYACRAGTVSFWSYGDQEARLIDYAWYNANSSRRPHPVGMKRPNAWGLYDIHGNVWEWCTDWHGELSHTDALLVDPLGPASGSRRVYRGGGWYNGAKESGSGSRGRYSSSMRSSIVGFRVVSTVFVDPATKKPLE